MFGAFGGEAMIIIYLKSHTQKTYINEFGKKAQPKKEEVGGKTINES